MSSVMIPGVANNDGNVLPAQIFQKDLTVNDDVCFEMLDIFRI